MSANAFRELEDSNASTDPTSCDPVRQFCSKSVETVESTWSDFHHAPVESRGRDTLVCWDVEDSSILRKVDPELTAEKIRRAMIDKGYYGRDSIWAFVDFRSVEDDMYIKFASSGIFIQEVGEGVKTIRSTVMATTILFSAMNHVAKPSCVLLLSEDKGFETVVDALKKHHFQAGLFKPNDFLCFDGAEEQKSGSSQAQEQIILCSAD